MYEKQRHVVQCSNISNVSPVSNYVLSETTLVTTFPTHTLSSLSSGSDSSIMCYRNELSLGHSSNTNNCFACIVCGKTWYRPSIKLSCQSYVIDPLPNHVTFENNLCAQCIVGGIGGSMLCVYCV